MKQVKFFAALGAIGLLSACSGQADSANEAQAAETSAPAAETPAPAADDDNDAAEPVAESSPEDHGHEHAEGEGEHSH